MLSTGEIRRKLLQCERRGVFVIEVRPLDAIRPREVIEVEVARSIRSRGRFSAFLDWYFRQLIGRDEFLRVYQADQFGDEGTLVVSGRV